MAVASSSASPGTPCASGRRDTRAWRARPSERRRRRRPRPSTPEVEARFVSEFYERHYRDWPDTPLPALGNRTPREAARRSSTRPKLVSLLKTMETMAERQRRDGRPAYDFRWMWARARPRAAGVSEELDVLRIVTGRFDTAGIGYMVTGSMALNYYAVPRMTRDIDMVVELSIDDVDSVCDLFREDFYVEHWIAQLGLQSLYRQVSG